MFCMFAEDIDLLPNKVFGKILAGALKEPARLSRMLHDLFAAMCTGGSFGADEILYFNAGLFADNLICCQSCSVAGLRAELNEHDHVGVATGILYIRALN